MDRDEIIETLKSMKELMATEFKINLIGLFGSVARNSYRPDSDVDILFVPRYDYIGKHSAEKFLSDQVGRKVSLCNRYRVDRDLYKRVLKDIIFL